MKEQILIDALAQIKKLSIEGSPMQIHASKYFDTIIKVIDDVLRQFHSTGKEKGLKWVKCSVGLPENGVRVVVKEKSGEFRGYTYWKDQEESWKKYIDEWLDESIEGEDRDKELAELKGIHDGEINLKDAAIVELSEEIERLKALINDLIKEYTGWSGSDVAEYTITNKL